MGALVGAAIVYTGYRAIQATNEALSAKSESNKGRGTPTRKEAIADAKVDAGVPKSQQPGKQETVPITDRSGKPVVVDGKPQTSSEYTHTTGDGKKVVIQDHGTGHPHNEDSHVHVRPAEDTRTGTVPGTKPSYPYKKPGEQ